MEAKVMTRDPKLLARYATISTAKQSLEGADPETDGIRVGEAQAWALLDIAQSLLAVQEILAAIASKQGSAFRG
jgi:hypothetical protein